MCLIGVRSGTDSNHSIDDSTDIKEVEKFNYFFYLPNESFKRYMRALTGT